MLDDIWPIRAQLWPIVLFVLCTSTDEKMKLIVTENLVFKSSLTHNAIYNEIKDRTEEIRTFGDEPANKIVLVLERDMAQWLECGALSMSLPEVRFRTRLVQDFGRNIMFLPSLYWDISMLCHWAMYLTPQCFTWLRQKWVPGRTEMAMCMISSMRRNGCRTVCSPWSWDGTLLNRPSDQGVKMWKSDEILDNRL